MVANERGSYKESQVAPTG